MKQSCTSNARAYNLVFSRATFDVFFKVDCDYVLSPEAIVSHKLSATQPFFYTGYYINARDANEMHLNGALLVSQRNFWNVGGYDERIRTYGYDDEDLYRRLVSTGLKRRNFSYDHVSHIGHEDACRKQEGVKFPRAQIDLNSLVLEQLNDPWTSRSHGSVYEPIDDNKSRLVATYFQRAILPKRVEEHGTGLEHDIPVSEGAGQRDRSRRRRLAYKLEKAGKEQQDDHTFAALDAKKKTRGVLLMLHVQRPEMPNEANRKTSLLLPMGMPKRSFLFQGTQTTTLLDMKTWQT